ncbi:hypothetical protein TWF225_006201 [Orbilia oligospora]|uniref:Uncharacterized protein n=1 Tax=Orbilia oligospora TaxID=2813651 RepID=A0A7C8K4K5_ORBOL|nr:hypothetical protein TWF751_010329 [Orbilia oligospora]KAF3183742.1 hypothetical protein TWF225_006201 [Orbilia oligospora]KAF3250932.1 hypothetical protein TWF128_007363 [Orbilia oligospora]KAF3259137.1 hypothetical protein TWF217_005278 [Orbilia oligospora]KAF3291895.1 hypothetical protein TWF132_006403 [Orbilia oligospora]
MFCGPRIENFGAISERAVSTDTTHFSDIPSSSSPTRINFTLAPSAMPQGLFTDRLQGYTPYQWAMVFEPPLVIPRDYSLQIALQTVQNAIPSHGKGPTREVGHGKPKVERRKDIFCPYLRNKGGCKFPSKRCVFSHDRRLLQKTRPAANSDERTSSGLATKPASVRAPALHAVYSNTENLIPRTVKLQSI